MLKLLGIFLAGFVSDFLIVSYYKSISENKILVAVACNSFILITNVVFVRLQKTDDNLATAIFGLGQAAGIGLAITLHKYKTKHQILTK
jgi:hypothetical protein